MGGFPLRLRQFRHQRRRRGRPGPRYDVGSAVLAQVIAIALIGCAIGAATARAGSPTVSAGSAACRSRRSCSRSSAIGSALPFALWDLAMWRVVGGIAIGMASVIGPAYIAEVSPPAYRGRLGSFQQAAIVIGIAISQLVNWGLLNAAGGDQRGKLMGVEAWQVMLGVMVIPAVLYGLLSFAIPESPRYLISVGHHDEARRILHEVEGDGIDLDARVTEIETAMRGEQRSTFADLLGGSFFFKPIVWVGIGLSVFQQFVGINVAFYYSSTLWQSVGVDPTDSFFYSFTTSIINIIGTVVAMLFVDRVGRRPLALIGSVGMAAALALEAWAFSARSAGGELPLRSGVGRSDRRPRLRPCSSPSPGASSSGSCSARCSPAGSAPPPSASPRPHSGSPTGPSRRASLHWPTGTSPART